MHARSSILKYVLWFSVVVGSGALASGADPETPGAESSSPESATAEPQRRPDAAQAVQEGDVDQWLKHYQRERGREWERAGVRTQPAPSSSPDAGGLPDAGARPRTRSED